MTIGHRLAADELSDTSLYELYSQLGERDTARLYEKPYSIDTEHDVPTGAGNSLDRKTKYIDRTLHQEVMDGAFKKTNLTPEQIIGRWLDHEHTEVCLADGDNPLDTYDPCHDRALKREHEGVLIILEPANKKTAREAIDNYEAVIWPGLTRCYHRPITKPPKDLWCAPLLDDPTERDDEILETFRKLGVIDATKRSKYSVHYGYGDKNCEDCSGWFPELISQENGQLAGCHGIAGLVRASRHCDMWRPRRV
jgi:hypothetical protein